MKPGISLYREVQNMRPISKLSDRVESSNVTWFVISFVVVLVGGYILHLGGAF